MVDATRRFAAVVSCAESGDDPDSAVAAENVDDDDVPVVEPLEPELDDVGFSDDDTVDMDVDVVEEEEEDECF
jgi:hypothetical protein